MKPSDASAVRIRGGIFPCASMSCAMGRSCSVAKSRAVRRTSSCESVSARSKAAPALVGSVLVVMAMRVLLVHVDADVPAFGIAREEVVTVEVTDDGPRGSRLVERLLHVVDPEPDHESTLAAHLGR